MRLISSRELERLLFTCAAALSLLVTVTCSSRGQYQAPGVAAAPASARVPAASASAAPAPVASVAASPVASANAVPSAAPAEPEALALPRFYGALAELSAGKRREHVRILWLGDSHTAADYLSGAVRRALQERFGAGGPGYLRLGVGNYRHGAAKVSRDGPWRIEPTPPPRRSRQDDGVFGLGGLRALAETSALAHIELRESALKGEARWQVLYSLDAGAKLKLRLAQEQVFVTADSPFDSVPGSTIRRIALESAAGQALNVSAINGRARLYGVIVEGTEPGLVLDTLGIDGARVATPLAWDRDAYVAEVAARKPTLAVMAYGTNEAFDGGRVDPYLAQFSELVARLRRGQPEIECLIVGPPDAGTPEGGSPARLLDIERVQRDAARQLGCGFFSLRLFMGGEGSYWRWLREDPPLARPDRFHFTAKGYEKQGQALAQALLAAYERESVAR
jgi:lysophospholipase L1-like esterase